jgi:hypothetical protein
VCLQTSYSCRLLSIHCNAGRAICVSRIATDVQMGRDVNGVGVAGYDFGRNPILPSPIVD